MRLVVGGKYRHESWERSSYLLITSIDGSYVSTRLRLGGTEGSMGRYLKEAFGDGWFEYIDFDDELNKLG